MLKCCACWMYSQNNTTVSGLLIIISVFIIRIYVYLIRYLKTNHLKAPSEIKILRCNFSGNSAGLTVSFINL